MAAHSNSSNHRGLNVTLGGEILNSTQTKILRVVPVISSQNPKSGRGLTGADLEKKIDLAMKLKIFENQVKMTYFDCFLRL